MEIKEKRLIITIQEYKDRWNYFIEVEPEFLWKVMKMLDKWYEWKEPIDFRIN